MKTKNPKFGFYGTIKGNRELSESEAEAAWSVALHLVRTCLEVGPETARLVLDSSFGRHLADAIDPEDDVGASLIEVLSRDGWRKAARITAQEYRAHLSVVPSSLIRAGS